ncbi:MAG: hypothetical protein R2706_06155 [Acidimicrobiales bacterium]
MERVGRDLDVFMAALDGGAIDEAALTQRYSSAEQADIVSLLRHLRTVQRVVLTVNRHYIASAATAAYRDGAAVLAASSYRNMARMAAKLHRTVTEAEVQEIIDAHYTAESQSLTGAAESNLLKLASLRGSMTADQERRWAEILDTFRRQQRLGGGDHDPVARVSLLQSTRSPARSLAESTRRRTTSSTVPGEDGA